MLIKIKQYLKEKSVQIALTAALLQIAIVLFLTNSLSNLGTVDFLFTIILFSAVLMLLAHLIGKNNPNLFQLFIIGFFGVLLYNQGIIILKLINSVPVPLAKDLIVAVEMGVLTIIVGHFRGVKK